MSITENAKAGKTAQSKTISAVEDCIKEVAADWPGFDLEILVGVFLERYALSFAVEKVKSVFRVIIIERISKIIEKLSVLLTVTPWAGDVRLKLKSARDELTVEGLVVAFMAVDFLLA